MPMIELWNRLFGQLRSRRTRRKHTYALEESLRTALVRRAEHEQRPDAEVQAEALEAGLAHLQTADWLKYCWDNLSPREQQVTALICLKYTNRQMASLLHISIETVKTHSSNIQAKFQLHSKAELRQALSTWRFENWDPSGPQEKEA